MLPVGAINQTSRRQDIFARLISLFRKITHTGRADPPLIVGNRNLAET
jgi:hypothetical protein